MPNKITEWKTGDGRTMEVFGIRNERRLQPLAVGVDFDSCDRFIRVDTINIPELCTRWTSGIVRVFQNKKTKKLYGSVFKDGCFHDYHFTFNII